MRSALGQMGGGGSPEQSPVAQLWVWGKTRVAYLCPAQPPCLRWPTGDSTRYCLELVGCVLAALVLYASRYNWELFYQVLLWV